MRNVAAASGGRDKFFDICDNNVVGARAPLRPSKSLFDRAISHSLADSFYDTYFQAFSFIFSFNGLQVKICRHQKEMKLYLDKPTHK